MKTKLVLLIMLVVGLVFIGCDNESTSGGGGDSSNTDPKSITITGLSAKTGKTVNIGVRSRVYGDGSGVEAYSDDIGISGTSVKLPLMAFGGNGKLWTGNGSFMLSMNISGEEMSYMYTNGRTLASLGITTNSALEDFNTKIPRYNIKDAETTIPFDQFRNGNDL
jgi:hypothetical protein